MMAIFDTLAPILFLVALGVGLARLRLLGEAFMADLNKLAFYVALPALLFRSAAHSGLPGPQTLPLYGILLFATAFVATIGWLAASVMQLPKSSRGTLSQASFRGNLAYIGIPVLAYSFEGHVNSRELFATAVVVMALLMATYNILAVCVLEASRSHLSWNSLGVALRAIVTNPLLLAGFGGLLFGVTGNAMPLFLDRSLEILGNAAVPIALLCIGGSLAHVRLGRELPAITVASLLKVVAVPLIVGLLGRMASLPPSELRIVLVLAACPTAAASYIMVKQMGGDGPLASGAIVMSTLLSGASLTLALIASQ